MSGSDRIFQPTTLVDVLRNRARDQADRTAYTFLVDGEHQEVSLTYQALEQQAQAIAAYLQSLGLAGERALLLYPPGLDYIAAFWGCLYAGVVAVPAYPPKPNRSLARIQAIVADAQPKIALTTQALLTKLKSSFSDSTLAPLSWLATDPLIAAPELLTSLDAEWQEPPAEADALALLQYTSGSTAVPKGVMITHRNLLHNLSTIQQLFEHRSSSKGVIWLPPYHDMGLIGGILQPLYSGFPVVLMSPLMFLQRPIRWLQAISDHRATTSGAPNFAYERCVRQLKSEPLAIDLSCWQVAFNGAEPIHADTLERFAAAFAPYGFRHSAFYPCYGLAEATLIVSGGRKAEAVVTQTVDQRALTQNQMVAVERTHAHAQTLVSCGRSLPDQQLLIVQPDTLVPCKAGEIGEIWVSGASVAQGYWQRSLETQETFQAQVAHTESGYFLRTGDLGFLQEGQLFVTGRLKDLIIIRGHNHYPQDIERTVQSSHPFLSWGCGVAFSITVDETEQLVIAQEVAHDALHHLKAEPIFEAICQAVADQHDLQVSEIILLKPGSIPKTSSGKLQRHLCSIQFLEGAFTSVAHWSIDRSQPDLAPSKPAAPLEPAERSLPSTEEEIQAWLITNLAMYLKVEPEAIDVTLPFANYGLDSSVAVSLTGELADWLGVEQLEPTLFWEYPSIEALAQYLGSDHQ